jgi:hypothetical protein
LLTLCSMFNKASIKAILFSNLFIALISLTGFWRSAILWNLDLPITSFYLVFFATFFIYSISSLHSGSMNATVKGYWNITHPQWSKFGSLVSGLCILGILYNSYELFPPLFPIGLLTVYYLSSSFNETSKQKVYFKTTILSLTWWYVLDVYPLILSHTIFESTHLGWILLDWAYIHLICFYFDHRDHSQENQPFLIFNQHQFPILIPIICTLVFSIGAYFFYSGPGSIESFLFFKSILFLFLLATYPISIRTRSYWWFYFILDGSLASDALYFWYF